MTFLRALLLVFGMWFAIFAFWLLYCFAEWKKYPHPEQLEIYKMQQDSIAKAELDSLKTNQ